VIENTTRTNLVPS